MKDILYAVAVLTFAFVFAAMAAILIGFSIYAAEYVLTALGI
jgi:hypothetical protein